MEKRTFTVTLELEANSEEQILDTYGIGRIIDSRFCESFEIKDPAIRHQEYRIKRYKDYCGFGENFVVESKWSDEDEWNCVDAYSVDDCDKINFHILGKIKELQTFYGINPKID